MTRAWHAPFAYLVGLVFAACSFPEVTIVEDPECLDDSGCTGGLRCGMDATCVPCVSSNHCAEGMVCAPDGSCVQCVGAGDCEAPEVCDTELGACVDCLGDGDCDGADVCAKGYCGPSHCANGTQDMDEIAVDCGGSCAGCELGTACTSAADCQSEICVDDQCSLPCVINANCEPLPGTFCAPEGGTCQLEKSQGSLCAIDDECQSGHCSRDGFCCDAACDQPCFACRDTQTGLTTGECGVVQEEDYQDPDCPELKPACNAAGECVLLPI